MIRPLPLISISFRQWMILIQRYVYHDLISVIIVSLKWWLATNNWKVGHFEMTSLIDSISSVEGSSLFITIRMISVIISTFSEGAGKYRFSNTSFALLYVFFFSRLARLKFPTAHTFRHLKIGRVVPNNTLNAINNTPNQFEIIQRWTAKKKKKNSNENKKKSVVNQFNAKSWRDFHWMVFEGLKRATLPDEWSLTERNQHHSKSIGCD